MDSRTAAHVLSQIAAYLELKGENTFKCRAYRGAAKGILTVNSDDLAPLYTSGELGKVRGLGPATLAVIRDLVEEGESRYLEELRQSTPEGLLDMLDIPGLTPERIHQIHELLGIQTIEELELAAQDGRLAKLPRYGLKTAQKILKGIAFVRENGPLRLYHHAIHEANTLVEMVRSHPAVERAEIAGSIRRRLEVAGDVDIVAACREDPVAVAQSFARLPGVKRADGSGAKVLIQFIDGAHLDLRCVPPSQFGSAFWRVTGSAEHVNGVEERLVARGKPADMHAADEREIYHAAGLRYVEPELREGLGEIDAAANGTLPSLIVKADLKGVLHCHTVYSDGKTTIAELARAAQARGYSYLGISDHSVAAFYAGGMPADKVAAQHEEIDELNATLTDFRVLKGIEADILADGSLDYGNRVLDTFDYVIGSIHSRFAMDGPAMTQRVLTALDDPHLTILAHPTGRLLLNREPYALDVEAVLEKAAAVGVAVEHNADPHRLDLNWEHLHRAREIGATVAIGPDAHSVNGLDYIDTGINIARKGWLEARNVLNTGTADDVLAFASRRRNTSRGTR